MIFQSLVISVALFLAQDVCQAIPLDRVLKGMRNTARSGSEMAPVVRKQNVSSAVPEALETNRITFQPKELLKRENAELGSLVSKELEDVLGHSELSLTQRHYMVRQLLRDRSIRLVATEKENGERLISEIEIDGVKLGDLKKQVLSNPLFGFESSLELRRFGTHEPVDRLLRRQKGEDVLKASEAGVAEFKLGQYPQIEFANMGQIVARQMKDELGQRMGHKLASDKVKSAIANGNVAVRFETRESQRQVKEILVGGRSLREFADDILAQRLAAGDTLQLEGLRHVPAPARTVRGDRLLTNVGTRPERIDPFVMIGPYFEKASADVREKAITMVKRVFGDHVGGVSAEQHIDQLIRSGDLRIDFVPSAGKQAPNWQIFVGKQKGVRIGNYLEDLGKELGVRKAPSPHLKVEPAEPGISSVYRDPTRRPVDGNAGSLFRKVRD